MFRVLRLRSDSLTIEEEKINIIRFADDIVIMAENETDLKNITLIMEEIIGN